jgi:anti-anti-sigma factor
MSYTTSVDEGRLIFVFSGRLDTMTSTAIQDEVVTRISGGRGGDEPLRVVFDLAGVDYVASSFLRLCCAAAKKLKPEKLLLLNLVPAVRRVFELAGLDSIIELK